MARLNAQSIGLATAACALVLSISGCASTSAIDTAFKGPADTAKSAAASALSAEQDVLRAKALGLSPTAETLAKYLLCDPRSGANVAATDLNVFVDALTAVDKVAEKPADTNYSTLLSKLSADRTAHVTDYKEEERKARQELVNQRMRCAALAQADLNASTFYTPAPSKQAAVFSALAIFAAINDLINTGLQTVEKAARAEAVQVTVDKLSVQLEDAINELSKAPNDAFGPMVHYSDHTSDAFKMNQTDLGATISLHRWWTARVAEADWNALKSCREAGKVNETCSSDPRAIRVADDFVTAVYQYRALAPVDTQKTLEDLRKGVAAARKAAHDKSISGIIDALTGVGDSLSTLNDKYQAYLKARN